MSARAPQINSRDYAELKRSQLIQEIHGYGPNYLLRENEDELCRRLLAKYEKHFTAMSADETSNACGRGGKLEAHIKENLLQRNTDYYPRQYPTIIPSHTHLI